MPGIVLIAPVKRLRVTQYFGQNPKMYARFGMRGHNGIDFGTKFPETPLGHVHLYGMHVLGGRVVQVGDEGSSGYGRFIRIDHPDGSQSVYGHLLKAYVKQNQIVRLTDIIGLTDNTGFSTGSHLHAGFRPPNWRELYNNGFKGYIDFFPFLKPRPLSL